MYKLQKMRDHIIYNINFNHPYISFCIDHNFHFLFPFLYSFLYTDFQDIYHLYRWLTGWPFYLEGVVLARSSPRVLMTRLPHTHSPMMIPAPPYTRIQMGVWVFWAALPSVPIIHRATRGPIELLKTKQMIHGGLVTLLLHIIAHINTVQPFIQNC